jgi:hypothetical protein
VARLTKAQERRERQAAWDAEQARIRALGDLFSALPRCPQKAALWSAMANRAIDLLNANRFEQADAILEFLPNDYAMRLLDWYFDEDENAPFPATPPAEEYGLAEQGQVQGEPHS